MSKWVYLAGLIDGDGSVFISKRGVTSCGGHGYYRLMVSITNCNKTLLDWLNVQFRKSSIYWQSNNYYAGHIVWEGPQAKIVLRKLIPHLVGKKEQAKLALKFPTLGRGAPGIRRCDLASYHNLAHGMYLRMGQLNALWSMGKVRGARTSKNKGVMVP